MTQPHGDQSDTDQADFLRRLSSVVPAEPSHDPAVVFYQAGYAAASAHYRQKQRSGWQLSLAAAACAMLIIVPLSYRAGQNSIDSGIVSQANTLPLPTDFKPTPAAKPELASAEPDDAPQSPERARLTELAPSGVFTSWISKSLESQTQRRPSLIGAQAAIAIDNESNFESSVAVSTEGSSGDVPTEPVLRRNDWHTMLPTL